MASNYSRRRSVGQPKLRLVCTLLVMTPATLRAESGTLDEARKHFDRGVQMYGSGELNQALAEFELAQQLQPHFAVLFNLGQVHAAMGHSVEAVDAYRRYVEQGDGRITSARRAQVETAILLHERRIGTLELHGDIEQVDIEVDGHAASHDAHSLRLTVGRHVVVARRQGYEPLVETIDVPAGGSTSVEVNLLARLTAPDSVAPAWVRVQCPVPDVHIQVDGVTRGKTPLRDPLMVDAGRRTVRFARKGYVSPDQILEVSPGSASEMSCDITPVVPLRYADSGVLIVKPSELGAKMRVDGVPFTGQRLPMGQHRVQIDDWRFLPWENEISISERRPTEVVATLIPTHEYREYYTASANRDRTLAYALGAAGIAAEATAIGLLIYNSNRFDRWQSERAQLAADAGAGGAAQDFAGRLSQINRDEASILRFDDAAFAVAFLGGALLVTATSLFIWGKDPDRFKSRHHTIGTRRLTDKWTVQW